MLKLNSNFLNKYTERLDKVDIHDMVSIYSLMSEYDNMFDKNNMSKSDRVAINIMNKSIKTFLSRMS